MSSKAEAESSKLDHNGEITTTPSFYISTRFLISFVFFLGFTIHFMQRTNMSIAVVCMVNSTGVLELDKSNYRQIHNKTAHPKCEDLLSHKIFDGKFIWSKADQGLILASHFYGYMITQVPGGWLAMRFGGRPVVFFSVLVPSILTILTPPLANLNSPIILMIIRFFTGVFHGLMFSSVTYLFSQWAPVKEKSRLIGFAQAGAGIGSAISPIFGGFLCENGFYEGWGSIFIIFGAIGLVWLLMLIFLTSDSPHHHKFISQEEKNYILTHIPQSTNKRKKLKTPWKAIFTSKACIAAFLANFFQNWGGYLFLTQTPTYMKDVLKFDIKANGLYSSLPFWVSFFITIFTSLVADKLITHKILSVKNCRKLFNSIGIFISAIASVALIFVDCSIPLVGVAIVTIGYGVVGCVIASGFIVNLNDIGGKHYAGVLFGISNTFGTIPGIIAPYFVGLMTPHGTIEEWRIVFIVTAIFYLFGGVPFLLFAEGEVEKWAHLPHLDYETKEEDENEDDDDNNNKQPLNKTVN